MENLSFLDDGIGLAAPFHYVAEILKRLPVPRQNPSVS
jgi:hypothetical protein